MTAYVVSGSDPSLTSRALDRLLQEIVEEPDSPEEHDAEGSSAEEGGRFDIAPLLDALATPSWIATRRVVVLRHAGLLTATQATELSKAVAEPLTDNDLVLVGDGKALSQKLTSAVKKAGGKTIETDPGRSSKARDEWFSECLARYRVNLDAAARRRLREHIGEEPSRLESILQLLDSALEDNKASVADIEPFLGEEGSVPPWELTDAIDSGDTEAAVHALRRMLGSPTGHPMRVLAVVRNHVTALCRLDGHQEARSAEAAAAVLKTSAYPAKKLFEQCRRLGHERVARAVSVAAGADADMRGRLGWPPELVLEVAVARLAQLSRRRAAPRPPGQAR